MRSWAQDEEYIYVSIEVSDPQDVKVDLSENSFKFTATSKGNQYHLDCELLHEIDVSKSKYSQTRVVSSRVRIPPSLFACGRFARVCVLRWSPTRSHQSISSATRRVLLNFELCSRCAFDLADRWFSFFSWSNEQYKLLLAKKDTEQEFWPRLLKDAAAYKGRLAVDWELWKDEDESDDEEKQKLGDLAGFQNMMVGSFCANCYSRVCSHFVAVL